jgi:hypothetical protein
VSKCESSVNLVSRMVYCMSNRCTFLVFEDRLQDSQEDSNDDVAMLELPPDPRVAD